MTEYTETHQPIITCGFRYHELYSMHFQAPHRITQFYFQYTNPIVRIYEWREIRHIEHTRTHRVITLLFTTSKLLYAEFMDAVNFRTGPVYVNVQNVVRSSARN